MCDYSKLHTYIKQECSEELLEDTKNSVSEVHISNFHNYVPDYLDASPVKVENLKEEFETKRDCYKTVSCTKESTHISPALVPDYNFLVNSSEKLGKPQKNVHSKVKRFKCCVCPYISARKCNLQTHMRVHKGEKPFACDLCPYKSSYKSDLNMHIKIHTGERPFKCNVCGYRCLRKPSLTLHLQTHIKEKSFKCKLCDYKSTRKIYLVKHEIIHIQALQKPLECKFCEYKCLLKGRLQDHMKSHIGEKLPECKICKQSSSTIPEKLISCKICKLRSSVIHNLQRNLLQS